MRVALATAVLVSLLLAACGRSNPPPAPSGVTQAAPAPASAPAAVSAAAAVTAPSAATAAGSVAAAAAATGQAAAADQDTGPEQAGDVVLAQGSVTDKALDGSTRTLKDGDDVFPGDALTVGDDSYLDIDFSDGGRILLRPDTSFQIQEYHFDPDAHPGTDEDSGEPLLPPATPARPENAFFKLVKGGLRAVDGLIGQTHHENYGIETPVATIGVRGTAFEVRYCGDDCQDEADATGAPANGLYTAVSEGSIDARNDAGESVIPAGESSYVQTRHFRPAVSKKQHRALRHMRLPEKYRARDDSMRLKMKARRQARRKAQLERRRQRAEKLTQLKQHPPARPAAAGGPQRPVQAAGKPGAREQRREERRAGRQQGKQPGAAVRQRAAERVREPGARQEPVRAGSRPLGAGTAPSRPGAGLLKKAHERKAESPRKPAGPAQRDKPARQSQAKADKPKADKPKQTDDSCKGKKKKKGKCGGD